MTSFRIGGAFGTANAILCNQIVLAQFYIAPLNFTTYGIPIHKKLQLFEY